MLYDTAANSETYWSFVQNVNFFRAEFFPWWNVELLYVSEFRQHASNMVSQTAAKTNHFLILKIVCFSNIVISFDGGWFNWITFHQEHVLLHSKGELFRKVFNRSDRSDWNWKKQFAVRLRLRKHVFNVRLEHNVLTEVEDKNARHSEAYTAHRVCHAVDIGFSNHVFIRIEVHFNDISIYIYIYKIINVCLPTGYR